MLEELQVTAALVSLVVGLFVGVRYVVCRSECLAEDTEDSLP